MGSPSNRYSCQPPATLLNPEEPGVVTRTHHRGASEFKPAFEASASLIPPLFAAVLFPHSHLHPSCDHRSRLWYPPAAMNAAYSAFVVAAFAIRNAGTSIECAHRSASNTHGSSRLAPSKYVPAGMDTNPEWAPRAVPPTWTILEAVGIEKTSPQTFATAAWPLEGNGAEGAYPSVCRVWMKSSTCQCSCTMP